VRSRFVRLRAGPEIEHDILELAIVLEVPRISPTSPTTNSNMLILLVDTSRMWSSIVRVRRD